MPKLAATLASLLLIASSIGVNIARYPQVGHALDRARSESVAAPVDALSAVPAAPSGDVAAPASSQEVAVVASSPRAGDADSGPAARGGSESPAAPSAPKLASDEPPVSVPIVDIRPLLPASEPRAAPAFQAVENEVRRLPPVEHNPFAVAEGSTLLPDYPTTATP